MAKKQYGIPPEHPLSGQIMRCLELAYLNLDEAAALIHIRPDTLERFLLFKSPNKMHPALWLLLNTNTIAITNTVYPQELSDFIATYCNNAFRRDFEPIPRKAFKRDPNEPARRSNVFTENDQV